MFSALVYLAAIIIALISLGLILYSFGVGARRDLEAGLLRRARLIGLAGILAAALFSLAFA